ncbi:hypothetical protein H257_01125 [Aphanomyces astaci]|uniref:Protein kinase domain-containing protein n=1 Tax=Aphanomyces astaci TaxID=112090 RepID=W4H946_APHAT|nr:hypothetical protein H257_01125 [Aphanomyces astaci]ETV87618.1 hypothetical protein H257_01125 [Aphanomyces astaci]|eukprot:XP_009822481.1 hypothetical protein H257_01125 [Aphanomyces astaci]
MDHVHRPSEHVFRFGEPEKQLMDCVVLFESQLRITDAAFGQVVQYLRRLFPTGSANGGSKALFESFVSDHTSPWVRLLTRACSALGVDVVEGGAFLGRGAHGRVFKVERKADKKVLALKLVDSSSKTALFREELALTNAELTGLTARLEHGFVEFPGGAALLVTPVGAPLPRPTTLQEVVNLFDLLRQLHEKSIIHGDPRVPNVIVVKDNDKDKLLWIDLVEAVQVTPGFRTTDAAILTRSILRLLHTSLLGEPLESLINEYGQTPTSENAHRMYHAKDAPMDHVHRPSEHVFRFGEPEKQLMDCVVLFESQLRITDAAFGQVVQYLRRLFPTGSANGGSKALFESFVSDHTSPWVRLLTRACSALGVDVVEGGAFLGRGAHGRVFKVERKADKKVLALKLVDSSSKTALFREELALTNAELTEVVNLFDLLRRLHEKNIIHGDPRVPNVIVVKDNDKDKLLWIDLVEAVQVTPGFRTTDAAILTRSILRLLHTSLLGEPLESLINEYGQTPTSENAHRLATAVFQCTKFSARR